MPQPVVAVRQVRFGCVLHAGWVGYLSAWVVEGARGRVCFGVAGVSAGQRSVASLDALLFREGRWFAIDVGNQRVARVVVPSLETGLGLVGDGPVASIVGRVRDEVVVVDVDVAGAGGDAIVEQLAAWCSRQGLWNLVRPSGGAEGRAHLFVVHEGLEAELRAQVAQARTGWGVSSRAVDVRRDVRPLSAPHRGGGHPRPLGQLVALARQLRARLAGPSGRAAAEQPAGGPAAGGGQAVAALVPRPRRACALPVEWERFLRTGVAPEIAGEDQSRSAVEAVATGHLLRAGHTASSAWAAIGAAHPQAMSKARASRRRWVAWVWNPAVRADLEWASRAAAKPSGRPRATGSQREDAGEAGVRADGLALAVGAARVALGELQWAVSPRRRPALLLVGHSVLDRMVRTGSVRVPVPERDLVLDTGIADRKTIRACLRLLAGSGTPTGPGSVLGPGLGVLHRVYDPKRKDASSFEFEILPPGTPSGGEVREIPPPSFHTPTPGTWSALPPVAHSLWRALTSRDSLSLEEVATAAGIPETRKGLLTRSQVRTTTVVLRQLAAAGLASCDAQGRWSAAASVSSGHAVRAAAGYAALVEQVAAERAVFRAAGASSGWDAARAAAAKTQRAKEQAWWNGLPRAEQARRRAAYAEEFTRLPVTSQEHAKSGWAGRRLRAGVDEAARHDAWLDQHTMDQVITRSVQRAARFAALPPPLQQAHAAAWRRHREKFGIARGTPPSSSRLEHASALPDTAGARDAAFLAGQRQPLPGFTTTAAAG